MPSFKSHTVQNWDHHSTLFFFIPESYVAEVSTIKQLASLNKINILIRRKKVKVAFHTTTNLTPLHTEKKKQVCLLYLAPSPPNLER